MPPISPLTSLTAFFFSWAISFSALFFRAAACSEASFTIPIDFPLFGKIQISETLVVSWIVMALITGLCIWLTRDLKIRNISKRQAVAEMIVETANKFVIGNMGEKFRYLIPFVSALFATSVVSNLISLIGLRSPTADLSTEAAWAVVVFIMITTRSKPTVLADI